MGNQIAGGQHAQSAHCSGTLCAAAFLKIYQGFDNVKNFKWWPVLGLVVVASVALTACSGSSSNNNGGSLRVVNLTLTHPSLDLLVNSSAAVSGTAIDTVSAFVGVSSGSNALQLNDNGQTTSLATTSPTITGSQHYALVAYEVSGAVKMAVLTEDFATPATGSAQLRVYDTATDAGALDVYVTAPGVDLSTVGAPTFTITALSFAQTSALTTFTPGTYEVRVTGSGVKSDLRADIPVVLTSQQIGTVVLTPAVGGVLLNGATLIQQGAYTAARNTSARVRLVAAVSSAVTSVGATAGTATIPGGTGLPSVGSYVTVPAVGPLSVLVNGAAQTLPVSTLVAGSDNTLMVYSSPTGPVVSVIADDNHLPTDATKLKLRLINGLTGTSSTTLGLAADFSNVASNVASGMASAYGLATASTSMRLDVTPSSVFSATGLNLSGNAVYSLFVLDALPASQTASQLVRDR